MQKVTTSDNSADEVDSGQQKKTKVMCPQMETIERILLCSCLQSRKIQRRAVCRIIAELTKKSAHKRSFLV